MIKDDEDPDRFEEGYMQGERAAWTSLFRESLKWLNMEDRDRYSWISEREAAIAALRSICAQLPAANDWPSDMHLGDIISKYLEPSLEPYLVDDSDEED